MGTFLLLAILIAIWQAATAFFSIPPFILPSPADIAVASCANWHLLFTNSLITLGEILLGIAVALIIAIPAAMAMFRSRNLERVLTPILVASQAIPVFAVAPLLIIWFGYGITSKIVMASVVIFFPITVSLLQGFKSCDREYRNLFTIMGAGFWQTMKILYWPWGLPYFFGGLKVGVSVATIGAVIGEWVGSQAGLGYLMIQSNARLKVDMVFASILWLTVMGLALWKLICILESKILRWKNIKEE